MQIMDGRRGEEYLQTLICREDNMSIASGEKGNSRCLIVS
jgi:hypothetical protein